MKLKKFLDEKGEIYKDINVDRIKIFWRENKAKFNYKPVAQIVGTNGKGSTGRILAIAALKGGLNVGHFTSPHIFDFSERFWLNGDIVNSEILDETHDIVLGKIGENAASDLSYFEYTCILAIELFSKCDLIILEAGLGGEFDATSVFDQKLLLVTPIAFDHQNFLGNTIKEIAATKLKAAGSDIILAKQEFSEVYMITEMIAKERKINVFRAENLSPDLENFEDQNSPKFMAINRQLSFAAAQKLNIKTDIKEFLISPLFGRMSQIAPNIILDVGHNEQAARTIACELAAKGAQVNLIYNSFLDKDFSAVLTALKPVVKRCFIIAVNSERIAKKADLERVLARENIEFADFNGDLKQSEDYLVFGSFSVAETFMKFYRGGKLAANTPARETFESGEDAQ
ncbi:MAG: bifunctional folylpolyglutamate synthase/dihydrofolate synthase [Helicobacteraceae bacterium]|jgi:dihydrofolate synthase/folylpolyglutamate synthase|nr:bifunctional folylpolyglutamate synthase/dihydrofolate synthase [Helicobacteraceae bacterium]